MTVLEVLQSATGYLREHGVESPRLQSEHLLASVLGLKRMDLYLQFDRPVSEAERAPLRDLVRRRSRGEPLQHLLGEWDFYGRTFQVDARALIPRPETELLAELVLKTLPPEPPLHVIDVGTGSGILAITLALERAHWQLTGCDISPDALALARSNASRFPEVSPITWLEADLLPPNSQWDAVVANLPYIPSNDLAGLSREVQHDPPAALDGGSDGLDLIRGLLLLCSPSLRPGGTIFLEFGAGQETSLESLLGESGFSAIKIHSDPQGFPRVATATKSL